MIFVGWEVLLRPYARRFGGNERVNERRGRTGWTADRRRLLPVPRGNWSVSSHSGTNNLNVYDSVDGGIRELSD